MKSRQNQLPQAPPDYEPDDIIINRNWKELGWPKKKVKAYKVYSFPTYIRKVKYRSEKKK